MSQLYTNNASAVLIEDLLPSDTVINLGPGAGDPFPLPDQGDPDSFAMVTLEDVNANFEICKLTSRSGDILTVERGFESTAPAGFAIGSRVECRLTAGSLQNFKQVADQWSLRGDVIDSDGIRYWHQQDPSTYQFYQIRYYTADLYGIPVMHIEPPASLPGLHVMAGVIASDGTQRVIRLGADASGTAPSPATGEVHFEVPAVQRWAHLTSPFSGNIMYATWANSARVTGNELKFETEGVGEVSYSWYTRTSGGLPSYAAVESDGSISVNWGIVCRSASAATYSKALDISMRNIVNPFDPGNMDVLQFFTPNTDPKRELAYNFSTYQKIPGTGGDPATYLLGTVNIQYGQVKSFIDPVEPEDHTPKGWTEDAITAAVTGPGLDALAALLYSRENLYSSAGTQDGSTKTLLNSRKFDDFYEIEVTVKDGDTNYVMRLDTETLVNNGYAPTNYAVAHAAGTGGDVRKVYFNPLSLTTFSATKAGSTSAGLTSVVGIGPKVQPVV